MRIVLALINILIGLLALAFIAAALAWAMPGAAATIWTIAYISMAVLAITGLIRAARQGRAHG